MTDAHAGREDQPAVHAEGTDPDFVTEPDPEEREDEQRNPQGRDDDASMQN